MVKWQTDLNKWYKIGTAKGVNIAAYNEISLAIVDIKGLVSLSSALDQNAVDYVLPIQAGTNMVTVNDLKWLGTNTGDNTNDKLLTLIWDS